MMTKEETDVIWDSVIRAYNKCIDNTGDVLVANGNGSWSPKLPAGNQDSFSDWMNTDNKDARYYSTKCECGVDVTYKGMEGTEYWHSHWCPKYKEKPKEEKK